MSKFEGKVEKYREAVRTKCGQEPDEDLLRKVTRALGPSIYSGDGETVAATDPEEIERIKRSFLMGKLGLSESDDLDGGISTVIETYGRSERSKYRAVVYYLLVRHFGKESVYG